MGEKGKESLILTDAANTGEQGQPGFECGGGD